ncbi:hypothetical protein ANCCAN_16178 [Ancylostoma caninum]|uniref:Uncharacterized protein n=1 Tax=Ancylostoma caninum TaxID=29170 RepID=A0A368G0Q0_ANCCA|nr:hypothetical protein ANCCAN_16178 [Ancylostoma caninum]
MNLQKVNDVIDVVLKFSEKLCLDDELAPVKKYIEARQAIAKFLVTLASDPKKYIDTKKQCFKKEFPLDLF